MDNQNMGYPYNEIVFSDQKEWSTNTRSNMDESQKP